MDDRVSNSQLEVLLEFLEAHRSLALGVWAGTRGKLPQDQLWEKLAQILNRRPGATKTSNRWKRYWINLKHKTRARQSARLELSDTGQETIKQKSLSEIDQKILSIIGEEKAVIRKPLKYTHRLTYGSNSPADRPDHILQIVPLISNTDPSKPDSTESIADDDVKPSAGELRNTEAPDPLNFGDATTDEDNTDADDATSGGVPPWVVDLEHRRVASEEKIADAMLMMAQASATTAKAMEAMSEVMAKFTHTFHTLAETQLGLINKSSSK